jgi:uncharacterized membrane protein YbhN (UPF0104 family)
MVAVAAGAAVFAAISIYGDVSEIRDRLAGFGWWAFAAAIGLALVNYALRFLRWSIYLRLTGIAVPTPTSALVFLSGFALSITPGKVGELIKSYLLRATDRVPVARSAPIVVAERITDLVALILLALAGVAGYGIGAGVAVAGAVVVAAGLLALAWPRLGLGVIDLVTRPTRLRRLGGRLREFYLGLVALTRPARLLGGTALAVVAWLAECAGFALIVSAFPGTAVPLGLATLIYAATTIAGALSFLPGGLVVTEATMTLWLVQAARGVDQPTAAAATILTRLATLWFAVLLGVVALAALRRRAPEIAAVDSGG